VIPGRPDDFADEIAPNRLFLYLSVSSPAMMIIAPVRLRRIDV
jgi:hypothetical protein